MCQPGKPCDEVLARVRELLANTIDYALADLITQVTTTTFHHLTAEGVRHLYDGMQTRDVSRIGQAVAHALIAERIPEHHGLCEAATIVRDTLMRRVLNKHGEYLGTFPEA